MFTNSNVRRLREWLLTSLNARQMGQIMPHLDVRHSRQGCPRPSTHGRGREDGEEPDGDPGWGGVDVDPEGDPGQNDDEDRRHVHLECIPDV